MGQESQKTIGDLVAQPMDLPLHPYTTHAAVESPRMKRGLAYG